jgi:beta,beta-carotene 9',10'-dioxygenase
MSFVQGFTTQPTELAQVVLPVTGDIPSWIHGTLVRNGPGQFEVGDTPIHHWFDGLAMLHSFGINGNHITYSNRYIRSNAYYKDNANGKINYISFAQDPCRALFKKAMAVFFETEPANNTVVNVTQLGDEYIAMTEFPLTVRFDPKTLETLGVLDYDQKVSAFTATAHPHYDYARRLGLNMMTHYGAKTAYQIYGLTDKTRQLMGETHADDISYIHSFATTPNYAIVVQFSFRLSSSLKLLTSGKPFIQNFTYNPRQDTIFSVIELASGRVVAQVPSDAFFAFHHINAYEDGDALIMDISAYDNADLVDELYVAHLRQPNANIKMGEFRRYHVPLKGGRATYRVVSDETIELPRIHYRQHNGRDYQFAYGTSTRRDTAPSFMNQLIKVDVKNEQTWRWYADGCYPSEPIFVPAPNATQEDEGVLLSVVLNSHTNTSYLLVLDAQTFGEIARAQVPQHVPFGFHGQFFGGV